MDAKEKSLFKEAIKFYENKQYKRGLKNCEQILKKYPDHGESLALKGLFMLYLGKREEAFEVCKSGLKLSLQSHISWHVLGLMYRHDKNYEEAIKCYKSALRIDKENFQILRDLALLQLQCRQFEGVIETRRRILLCRPTAPFNWISIVIAYHMSGNLRQALDALDGYLELFTNISDPAQDHLYYKVSIMSEMGLFSEAMAFMKQNIRRQDTRRYMENFALAAFGAKDYAACEETARRLFEINPDSREYVALLLGCCRAQQKSIPTLFDSINEKSLLAGVEFLKHLAADEFSESAPVLLRRLLHNGSPAVFSLFKGYIGDSACRKVIWDTVCVLLGEEGSRLASLAFAANFQSAVGEHEEALKHVEQLIALQPEQKDALLLKARILKRAQQSSEAVAVLESEADAFSKDKFSASKVAKYELRHGSIAKGQATLSLFIQKPSMQERIGDLHEMQATWYLVEMADRLLRDGMLLDAACFYRKIEMIFDEFMDDQLEFHGYSIRRMSFVDYVKFLRYLDSDLKKSPHLRRALIGQASVFLRASNENDLAASLQGLSLGEGAHEFADNLATIRSQLSALLLSKKSVDEALKRICHSLLQNHSDSAAALECCLEIAVELRAKLLGQNILGKLRALGRPIQTFEIEQVNSGRDDEVWKSLALFE